MKNTRWMVVMGVGLACIVSMTGCKSKKVAGAGGPNDGIAPLVDPNISGDSNGLAGRPGDVSNAKMGAFEALYFDFDSAQVRPDQQSKVDAIAAALKDNANENLIVEGHCDERGNNEYNMALGERRALAVRQALIAAGVDGARLQTRSMGEEKPVAMEHNEEAWSKNRRCEFGIF